MNANDTAFPTDSDQRFVDGVNGLTKREYATIQIAAALTAGKVVYLHDIPTEAAQLADQLLAELERTEKK